jgi:hypothetical protein
MALVIGEIPQGFDSPSDAVLIPLPPQNGGALGWGQVYLSFGADFHSARLRVAVWNDPGKYWRVNNVDVLQNGGRVNVAIQDGDSKVSVVRLKLDASDPGNQPVGWMLETSLKA